MTDWLCSTTVTPSVTVAVCVCVCGVVILSLWSVCRDERSTDAYYDEDGYSLYYTYHWYRSSRYLDCCRVCSPHAEVTVTMATVPHWTICLTTHVSLGPFFVGSSAGPTGLGRGLNLASAGRCHCPNVAGKAFTGVVLVCSCRVVQQVWARGHAYLWAAWPIWQLWIVQLRPWKYNIIRLRSLLVLEWTQTPHVSVTGVWVDNRVHCIAPQTLFHIKYAGRPSEYRSRLVERQRPLRDLSPAVWRVIASITAWAVASCCPLPPRGNSLDVRAGKPTHTHLELYSLYIYLYMATGEFQCRPVFCPQGCSCRWRHWLLAGVCVVPLPWINSHISK